MAMVPSERVTFREKQMVVVEREKIVETFVGGSGGSPALNGGAGGSPALNGGAGGSPALNGGEGAEASLPASQALQAPSQAPSQSSLQPNRPGEHAITIGDVTTDDDVEVELLVKLLALIKYAGPGESRMTSAQAFIFWCFHNLPNTLWAKGVVISLEIALVIWRLQRIHRRQRIHRMNINNGNWVAPTRADWAGFVVAAVAFYLFFKSF
ncbi:hypothetical protein CASFOL_020554 [Castilleja foliolosa]|uniref:Uncharacterized protein n=1 Tax=Castilleja foliolosa TaxID=1961234 RepID=A0ABD3D2P5_9LAMI